VVEGAGGNRRALHARLLCRNSLCAQFRRGTFQRGGARIEPAGSTGGWRAGVSLILGRAEIAAPGGRVAVLRLGSRAAWRSAGHDLRSPRGRRLLRSFAATVAVYRSVQPHPVPGPARFFTVSAVTPCMLTWQRRNIPAGKKDEL